MLNVSLDKNYLDMHAPVGHQDKFYFERSVIDFWKPVKC